MDIIQNIMTRNDCYKSGKKITPSYIAVHDTGANNKYIKRYSQPDVQGIGKNPYNNHWNRPNVDKAVHFFVGALDNGEVAVVQTLPTKKCYRSWHAGRGKHGTANDFAISFEICQDTTDMAYSLKAYNKAVELAAYLCSTYNIPVKNVLSHHELYKLGVASQHVDTDNWFPLFGKDMNTFRKDVENLMATVDVNKPDDWAKEAWEWGKNKGITDGTRPKDKITRQEVMQMLYKLNGGK